MVSRSSLVLALALVGCGLGQDASDRGEGGDDMEESSSDEAGEGPQRPLVFGIVSEDGTLEAWDDGTLVEIVIGFQGLAMITFHVEAPIEPGDPDGEDWCVRTTFTDDPSDPFDGLSDYCHAVDVDIVDGRMRLGPVLRILTTKEHAGASRALAVEVSTDTFTSVDVRTLELY